jgi:hypothetical protein
LDSYHSAKESRALRRIQSQQQDNPAEQSRQATNWQTTNAAFYDAQKNSKAIAWQARTFPVDVSAAAKFAPSRKHQ